ncbi:NHL repeat domain-containing protein [Naegleria gruberi]|uniref:NHL repeat domain-containing protein n=1 Tax=Naegleria gruberi TaxID=5762 RepID=D2V8B8_NAEGR|nr:NHL repeat domain-containing protein [Naegleria gruberi]EFC47015.1 NHL repeat domain-containing protein [Naegleria gruberi]|eukprot:XP_002679759.1 NHL repeat domain-containing protein [Naegleria gruberi strain NEG-M]
MPTNLCIEEWDKYSNDIIISGNNTHVYKYSLEECMKSKPKPLWICDKINSPNGIISVSDRNNSNENYRKETSLLYVCDMFTELISIVKSQTGQVIGNISLLSEMINVSCPWSIGMNNLGQFIISGLQNSSKHIIEIIERQFDQKKNQYEWKSIKVIENEEDKLKYPFGLVVDSVSLNIIVCDSLNHRLMVFKQDGTLLKVFGSKGRETFQLSTPMGLCINKLNGELLVADSENHRILCYK